MKKILSFSVIIIMLVLSGCSVAGETTTHFGKKTAVASELRALYPDAEITSDLNSYGVTMENVVIDDTVVVPDDPHMTQDGVYFSSVDDALGQMNMLEDVVFCGKKTGKSKQYICYDKKTGRLMWCHTESVVQVTKPLYGNIKTGDEIIYREWYAVVNREGDSKFLVGTSGGVVSSDECLYVLSKGSESDLFSGNFRYNNAAVNVPAVDIAYLKENQMTDEMTVYQFFEKYIVNQDVVVDVEKELQKATEYKKGKLGESAKLTDDEVAMIQQYADR